MIIEYKVDPGNKYYKAVLIINLDTFIFNEVSFERFKPILAKEVQKV